MLRLLPCPPGYGRYVVSFPEFVGVAQQGLLALVLCVSIGIYGTFYVLRSMASLGNPNAMNSGQLDRYETTRTQEHPPQSARDLGLVGFPFGGILGPVAVVLAVVPVIIGRGVRPLRHLATWVLSGRPKCQGPPL